MASRHDQLLAYQFMTQRMVTALVMRETDPRQSPLRRGVGAIFGGLMIAIVLAAGFGVYGILTKVGSDGWKTSGSVVIEKETGASFVYLDGVLHPTLNLASAMLAAGQPRPAVFHVASNSLATVARGVTVGIPGAPDSLPDAAKQVGLPWTMCAVAAALGSDRPTSMVTLAVGVTPVGGRALADEAILVRDAKLGMTYLVWHGRRHLIQSSRTVVPALFGAVNPLPVGTAWLNAMIAGVDIGPITVGGRGGLSPAVRNRKIGDILVVQTGSGPQYYLVFDDGVAPLTGLQKDILGVSGSVEPIRVELSAVSAAPRSSRLNQSSNLPPGEGQPPVTVPTLMTAASGAQLCAVTRDTTSAATVWLGGTVSGLDRATPTASSSSDGISLADRVLVPAGRVAVLRVRGAPGAEPVSFFVLTDVGVKYPLPSAAVLAVLGYSLDRASDVPSSLVNRIPTGPTLDPAAAVMPAPAGGGTN